MNRNIIISIVLMMAVAGLMLAGCNNVQAKSEMETSIKTCATAAQTAMDNGVPAPEKSREEIANDNTHIAAVYAGATSNHFAYTFGAGGKNVYMKTEYMDNAQDMSVAADVMTNRLTTMSDDNISACWRYVKQYQLIQGCWVRGQEYPAEKTVSTRDLSPRIVIPLNQLRPYLENLSADKIRALSLNDVQMREFGDMPRDVDWAALAAKAADALKTGMSAIWQYFLNNSTTAISLSETELTELISALQREDKTQAKKILAAAMDDEGLKQYAELVASQGKVLATENKVHIDQMHSFLSGGITAGLSAAASLFTGN